MDVAESEDAAQFGAVDATDYGHPFPGAPQSWQWCSSSCQYPDGCAMDVDESDATTTRRDVMDVDAFAYAGQQYCWPYSVKNNVHEEGQQYATDFTASYASYGGMNAPGDGQFASADQQFSSWPYGVINNVHQAQWSDDGPTYGKAVDDDDMCLVGATTDDDCGSESDSSDGVIVIV